MKKYLILLILLSSTLTFSQKKITLDECYHLLNKNYPLAKNTELLANQNKLDLAVIETKKLPQLEFLAQASYQSDVTHLPISIPNITIDSANKDQYKTTISLNQLIYASGTIQATSNAKKAALKTNLKQIEVQLYQLKKQVNQLYFSILLQQEKKQLLISKKELLKAKLKEIKAGIKFGSLLPSSDSVLEAELLKIEQQFTEINTAKKSLIETLSQLIGFKILSESNFENPTISTSKTTTLTRPEIEFYNLKKSEIESQQLLISKQNAPKVMGFATGGYGNPGLNMLDNSFTSYYMVGVKLNWNVFDWNATKKQQKSLAINKDIVENDEAVFKINTNTELYQQQQEITKIESFIKTDISIIKLRKNILKTAASQLKNGVITSSAYITEFTNLFEAENNLATHKIQLLLAKTNYNTTKGN